MTEPINPWYLAAGLAALATALVHALVGGRLFATPLLECESLPRIVRTTLYFCWHIVTATVAAMAIGFFYVSVTAGNDALAMGIFVLATAIAVLCVGIALVRRVSLLRMPQWVFFAIIAALGAAGL